MPKFIQKSVGRRGANATAQDVMTVQYLLNCVPVNQGGPSPELAVDGIVGPKTIAAIEGFQSRIMPMPDGRVDAGGPTITCLQKYDPYPTQPMPAVPGGGRGAAGGKGSGPGLEGSKKWLPNKSATGKIFDSGMAGLKDGFSGKAAAGAMFEAGMAAFKGWKAQLAAIDEIFDSGMGGIKDLLGSQAGPGVAPGKFVVTPELRDAMKRHSASKAAGNPQLTPEAKAAAAKYYAAKMAGKNALANSGAAKGASAKAAGYNPGLSAKDAALKSIAAKQASAKDYAGKGPV